MCTIHVTKSQAKPSSYLTSLDNTNKLTRIRSKHEY